MKFGLQWAGALMLMTMLCACNTMMPWDKAAENVANSRNLRVGMDKSQVLEVMGEPVRGELYCRPDIWFYYIKTEWADGLTTEDECMPLVFVNGNLAGWGNEFYTRWRLTGSDLASDVKLPETSR